MEDKLLLQNQLLIMKALHVLVDDEGYKHLAEEMQTQIKVTEEALKDESEGNLEVKLRTKEDWLQEVNEMLNVFGWAINLYFGSGTYNSLQKLIQEKKAKEVYAMLNSIWFKLPDGRFNIEENPTGWYEFLGCVEFYNGEESKAILK